MGFFENLRRRLSPARMVDPVFGPLLFMYLPQAPERSYWEADRWLFAPTQTRVTIALAGTEAGPDQSARAFYLRLADRFPAVMEEVQDELDRVTREWLGRPLAPDPWEDYELTGFDVEDPRVEPVEWSVSFETIGDTWVGVTIPFVGDDARSAVVDT